MSLLLSLSLSPAHACGGFFCNGQEPVDQAGEVVVFEVDEEAGETTMHVRVDYEGPASDFAWVVPVPANPETFITTGELFDVLDEATQPAFVTHHRLPSTCGIDSDADTDADSDVDVAYSYGSSADTAAGGVRVVSTGTVGPYDQAVLQATDGELLVQWLQDNGFAVPDGLSPLLDPYTGVGTHFLALRLTKGESAGALEPLGLTWSGTTPGIPIGLTAVAATDDMPLRVYLLGDHRGVPTNYHHVELNPLWMPWSDGHPDGYDDVVRRAVDQGGGRAFVTSFSGSLTGWFDLRGSFDLDGLDQASSARDWFDQLARRGFQGNDDLLNVLLELLPPPEGVDPTDFYNCPGCYDEAWDALDEGFDAVAATDTLLRAIVEPLERAQAVLDQSEVTTRLDTLISPFEMTVDPQFAFAPGLGEVASTHTLVVEHRCDEDDRSFLDEQVVQLPTGHTVTVSRSALLDDQLRALSDRVALRVEQLHADGSSTVVADHSAELDALDVGVVPVTETAPVEVESGAGCGCRAVGSVGWGPWGLALLAVARRRRLG
jgi:hypothetical protein